MTNAVHYGILYLVEGTIETQHREQDMNAQATLWHWACKFNSHDVRFDCQELYVELINDDTVNSAKMARMPSKRRNQKNRVFV